ncbi:hypothetical protein [Kibdelosporangium aridum]
MSFGITVNLSGLARTAFLTLACVRTTPAPPITTPPTRPPIP